jgi:hypothetical protein
MSGRISPMGNHPFYEIDIQTFADFIARCTPVGGGGKGYLCSDGKTYRVMSTPELNQVKGFQRLSYTEILYFVHTLFRADLSQKPSLALSVTASMNYMLTCRTKKIAQMSPLCRIVQLLRECILNKFFYFGEFRTTNTLTRWLCSELASVQGTQEINNPDEQTDLGSSEPPVKIPDATQTGGNGDIGGSGDGDDDISEFIVNQYFPGMFGRHGRFRPIK